METKTIEKTQLEIRPRLMDEILENTRAQREGEEHTDLREKLKAIGFKAAGDQVDRIIKMRKAYAEYPFIPQDKVDIFNQRLKEETLSEDKRALHYKHLVFTPIDEYDKVPPDHVLSAMSRALERGYFDSFEVAHIKWIHEVKDPIVFGRIGGCTDRFFIAQWDDDISFEELLAAK